MLLPPEKFCITFFRCFALKFFNRKLIISLMQYQNKIFIATKVKGSRVLRSYKQICSDDSFQVQSVIRVVLFIPKKSLLFHFLIGGLDYASIAREAAVSKSRNLSCREKIITKIQLFFYSRGSCQAANSARSHAMSFVIRI